MNITASFRLVYGRLLISRFSLERIARRADTREWKKEGGKEGRKGEMGLVVKA